jgi:hypothetical protein
MMHRTPASQFSCLTKPHEDERQQRGRSDSATGNAMVDQSHESLSIF